MRTAAGVWRRVRRAAFAVVIVVAGCAEVQPPNAFEEAFNDETKPWQEVATQLPPLPTDRNLLSFSVSGATQYRFAIDRPSLSIGDDGVYRYTLVAISPQGVRNVSYEGIRCLTNERKIYAIGRIDGTWSRARNAAWVPIVDVGTNRQHAALETEYFCPDGYAARDVATIYGRMKPGLAPSEADFDRQSKGLER